MTAIAGFLLIALGCAGLIIACLVLGIYDTRKMLNKVAEEAERYEAEANGLQVALNHVMAERDAALARLSRKPKIGVGGERR